MYKCTNVQINNILYFMEENIILKKVRGGWYTYLHLCLMVFSSIILLFDNNIYHLLILLNIIFLDGIANVVLKDCPLTVLEEQHLGTSIINERMKSMRKIGIDYNCCHKYESTLELIINIGSLLCVKITILLAMKLFDMHF